MRSRSESNVKPRRKPMPVGKGRPHRLTDRQRRWIAEYLIDMNASRAAAVAGYRHPDVAGSKLLNARKYPLVVAEVQRAMARKELVAEKKADDVLRYIHTAMFFCPADYFDPGGNGGWLIDREDYRALPSAIKCLVEEMECIHLTSRDGTTTTRLWVRFVSKATAMTLAAKHQLGEKVVVHQGVDWDSLLSAAREERQHQPNVIEGKLAAIEQRLIAESGSVNGGSNGSNREQQ